MRGVSLCSWILAANTGITYARFMPNSEYALIGGFNHNLGIYEVKTGVKKKKYVGLVNNSIPLVHSYGKIGTEDYYIFGASENDEVHVWNLTSEALEQTIKLPKGPVVEEDNVATCVDYHEKSQRLAICGPNSRNTSYIYQLSHNPSINLS